MTDEEAQATAATDKGYLTVHEAARQIRATEADILRWIKAGLVPARKIDGRWYIVKGNECE